MNTKSVESSNTVDFNNNNILLKQGDQAELFKQLKDSSIDAIVTDPPYGVLGKHKIETNWCIETFIKNCHRVLKEKGFLVYFCQEPFASKINSIAYKYFSYKEEIIWNKISHNFRPSAKVNRST